VLQQSALSHRAHAAQLIEDGMGHRTVPAAAVMLDREAMRLVADPLEEPQGLGVRADGQRLGATRDEHLLDALGQPDHRDVGPLRDVAVDERRQGAHAGAQLSLAAVDDDQVGK
jgi:hypothetical protein